MPQPQKLRKTKRTFSLSRDILSYLESERRATKQKSLSAVLEEVVRHHQEKKEMERVSAAFTHYYDTRPSSEAAEERAWGDFAATQFPDEV